MAQARKTEQGGRAPGRLFAALVLAALFSSCERPGGASPAPAGGGPAPPGAEAAAAGVPPGVSAENATVPVRLGPSWRERDDPARDGWDTEVESERAGRQLELASKLVLHPGAAAGGGGTD